MSTFGIEALKVNERQYGYDDILYRPPHKGDHTFKNVAGEFCPNCNGCGKVAGDKCETCRGGGLVYGKRKK